MPLFNYNDEITYNDLSNYGIYGGYSIENKNQIMQSQRHHLLLPLLSIDPGQTILLVGVGFGWLAESWIQQGLGPICAVDTSQWIQSNKSTNSTVEIYNYDVTDYSTHDSIKQTLGLQSGDKIDWCITEDFFTEIHDHECIAISNALRILGHNVIHYITRKPPQEVFSDTNLILRNWKTEAEWEAMLTPDQIIIRK